MKVESEKCGLVEKAEGPVLQLIAAVKALDLEKIHTLLGNGANVWEKDEGGRTALHFACNIGK